MSKLKKHNINILYVEDEDFIRDELAKLLTYVCNNLYLGKDGKEGYEAFQSNQIDLVITDINIPEYNGIEMLYKIRQIDGDVPAIILSAYNPQDFYDNINFIDILNDYIAKPFKIKDLFERIELNVDKIKKRKEYKDTYKLLQQYKKALDTSAIVSKTNKKGVITYVNDKFCELSGYLEEELIGKPHNIIRDPNLPKELFQDLWQTLKDKKVWKGELTNRGKNGDIYHTDSTIIPILDSEDNVLEYLAIRFDITEHKVSLQKAKDAEKIKGRFLANMSHEIRTPINGIIGFLDLLDKTDLNTQQTEFVSIIKNSSSTLLSIINDILDFSKIEANEINIENIDTNFIEEIKLLTKMFLLKADENSIIFKFEYDKKIPNCLKCDPLRIKQIITNLINNAIKFTKDGEVTLQLKLLNILDNRCNILFSIKDTGIGIPKDKQKTIFEPFLQTDVSISRKYGGTGLGLSITKQLIELLNGELKVQSELGEGSEFYFDLEFDICTSTFSKKVEIDENLDITSKILVAEDNLTNQMLIKYILGNEKIDYKIVGDGLKVVEAYKEDNSYNMILMDINMPLLDGVGATKEIIEYEKINNIEHTPIIALTANAITGDRESFLANGMDDYLSKPIDIKLLRLKIAFYSDKSTEEIISIDYDKNSVGDEMELPIEFLEELLNSFFEIAEGEIIELENESITKNFDKIGDLTHSIKGASANLRLNEIYEKAMEIEQMANLKSDGDYVGLTKELKELILKYKKGLE